MEQVKNDSSAIGLTVPASLIPREAGTQATDTSRSLELETLSDIARVLSGAGGFEEKATQVAARMAQAAEADWAVLRIPDDYALGLKLIASVDGVSEQSPRPQVLPYGQGMCARAFAAEKSIISHDYPKHPGAFSQRVDAGTKSTLALPLLLDGRVIGVFLFGSRKLGHFTDNHVALMETVARQLSPLLENAKLQQELAVTDEIARIITSTLDIGEVYERFAAELKKLVDYDRIAIHTIDEDAGTSIIEFSFGTGPPGTGVGAVRRLQDVRSRELVAKGKSIIVGDIAADAGFRLDQLYLEAGLHSVIIVPLVSNARVAGALTLRSRQTNAYGKREQTILERLANQIAPALVNAKLFRQLQISTGEIALVDEVAKIVSSTLEIGHVYQEFAHEMKKLVPFDYIAVNEIDERAGIYAVACVVGPDLVGFLPGAIRPLKGSYNDELITSGKSLVRNDISAERRFGLDQTLEDMGFRSHITVPLLTGVDHFVGSINLFCKQAGAYGKREQRILERLASQIAPAVENSALFRRLRESMEEMAAADEVARIVTSTLNIYEVYEGFAAELKKLVDFDRMGLNVVDQQAGVFTIKYLSGETVLGSRLPPVCAIEGTETQQVVATGNTLVRDDFAADLRFPLDQDRLDVGLRSGIRVPLIAKGHVAGTIFLTSRRVGAYGPREQAILERLAHQIAPAVENSVLFQQLQESTEEMALVDEVARIVTSTLDIGGVYEQFATGVKTLVDFDQAIVTSVDGDNGTITLDYVTSPTNPVIEQGQTLKRKGTGTGYIADSGQTLIHGDLAVSAPFWPWQKYLAQGLRSVIGVPLISNENVAGAFALFSRRPHAYGRPERRILERLASQMAPAVINAKLYEETRRSREKQRRTAEENRVMAEIARVVGSSLNIGEVYKHLGEAVRELIPFDRMSLSLIDHENRVSSQVWVFGMSVPGRQPGDIIPLAGTLVQEVIRARSPVMLEADTDSDLGHRLPGLLSALHAGLRSFLAVPLIDRDAVIGVLQMRSITPGVYSQRDLDLAERIGNQIAGALANAQLYENQKRAERTLRLRTQELGALFNMASILNQAKPFDEKVKLVLEELLSITPADLITLRVPDEQRQALRLVAAVGSSDLERPVFLPFYDQGLSGLAFHQGKPLVVQDYTSHPLADRSAVVQGTKSLVSLPIEAGGKTLGIVNVVSHETGCFTPEVVELLTMIGYELGVLLENARLEEEREQTEQRMHETARLASIGELAAGVAHEINNPLTSVLGYSEMVLRSDIPEEHRKDIQTISDEAQRAAKIVKNLLFFARKSGAEKQYTDLNTIVNRALEMKSYDFKVSNISVTTQLSPEIRKTMADEHQLVQVFLNILTNAEQVIHMANGKGQIGVCTAISGDGIEITIKDDGPGMSPEVLRRIFEPFFTTKDVGQGTGLGLSISYGIIKQHGGDIIAESVEGEGTTFHITLPVVLPEEITVFPVATPVVTDQTTKHLLVVDDEPHIRNLLRRYLELERYTVDLADDGQEAWRKLANMDYDCILLDLKMPGISGQQLYQLIQEISQPVAGRVVFITGDTISESTRDFVSQTGNPLIMKPFRLEELLRAVHELWDRAPVTT